MLCSHSRIGTSAMASATAARPASGSRASSTTSARSAAASSSRARRMPSRSITSPPSRSPAVSTSVSSTPSMRTTSRNRSRVVPAISVTIARSLPASAFNSELLPAFGGPTITACSPSRSFCPRCAATPSCAIVARSAARRARSCGIAQRVQRFVGEIDQRFHLDAHCEQLRGERIDASRELAVQRATCGARRLFAAGGDQVGDGFGLGQVELAVAECAFAVFARARHPRAEFAATRDQSLQQRRDCRAPAVRPRLHR